MWRTMSWAAGSSRLGSAFTTLRYETRMGSWWTEMWIGVLCVGEAGRRAGSEEAISQLELRG